MGYLDDASTAIAIAIMLLALALAVPYINITFPIEVHLGQDLPTLVTTILRLSIIALAISIGTKPLAKN